MYADRSHGDVVAFKNLGEDGILDIFGRTDLMLFDYLSLHNKSFGDGSKLNRLFMSSLFSYQ